MISLPVSHSPDHVAALRRQLWANGFRPVAVYNVDANCNSPGKQPFGAGWQISAQQNPPRAVIDPVNAAALNTGIWCGGLRALDIDIDDHATADAIEDLARQHLGDAPARVRTNSGKRLLLYRAADGEPRKTQIVGNSGKIEVLGFGQHFTAFGMHPSGVAYEWRDGCDPTTFNRDDPPAVSEEQELAFFDEARPLIGAEPPSTDHVPTQPPPSPVGRD